MNGRDGVQCRYGESKNYLVSGIDLTIVDEWYRYGEWVNKFKSCTYTDVVNVDVQVEQRYR